jgi:hypothetical protein
MQAVQLPHGRRFGRGADDHSSFATLDLIDRERG